MKRQEEAEERQERKRLRIALFNLPVIIVLIAIHLFLYIMQYFWTPNNKYMYSAQLQKYSSATCKLLIKFNEHDLVFTYAFHRINIKVAYCYVLHLYYNLSTVDPH